MYIRIQKYSLGSEIIFLALNSVLQIGSVDPDSLGGGGNSSIEPLPGLETILEELQQEDG